MNKDWDKVCVSSDIWRECLRVLKPGAFAFIMSAPRQDVLSRMIVNLQDAGFETGFTSLYWSYAAGFPKAANVSKLVDKRNGRNFDISFKDYLNQKRNEKCLSFHQINEYLGTALTGGGTASAIMGDKEFNELPTLEIYKKLKTLLDLDDRFDALIEREEAEREIIGWEKGTSSKFHCQVGADHTQSEKLPYTKSATEQAKALDGSYAGFQPKPAVEVILVCMKPLSEKSYVDQALANRKGISWLDDCRIPYQNEDDKDKSGWQHSGGHFGYRHYCEDAGYGHIKDGSDKIGKTNQKGRFPANLLVSDDVLNDGKIRRPSQRDRKKGYDKFGGVYTTGYDDKRRGSVGCSDSVDSYSRYFDLDKWFDTTFPFAIIPKASKTERNMGLITSYLPNEVKLDQEQTEPWTRGKRFRSISKFPKYRSEQKIILKKVNDGRKTPTDNPFQRGETLRVNTHPTVKPLKLMAYLIMLGSRENDLVLDPFCGSGTTLIAAKMLNRRGIGIEINQEYCEIAHARSIAQLNKVVI